MKIDYHTPIKIVIDGKERIYLPFKKQYRGHLGARNAPHYPANTFVMQSSAKPFHFYLGLN